MPVLESIALYIGKIILAESIKRTEWPKKLRSFFFPSSKYETRLTQLIYETIYEFEKDHPYDTDGNKYPFYHSQLLFEKLSLFILYKRGSLENIKIDFKDASQIIQPTNVELEEFYSLFLTKIRKDKVLSSIYIEDNYKEQVYTISMMLEEVGIKADSIKSDTTKILDHLESESERIKLSDDRTIESLKAQVKRQIKKQINSGKYLPDTFIETNDSKDHLRYLCDPIFYSDKCFEEIEILDFRLINANLKKQNIDEFNLNLEEVKTSIKKIKIDNCTQVINSWYNHLLKKNGDIKKKLGVTNEYSRIDFKFRDRFDDLHFLKSKVALITETAGQGKTNFLCDFSDNFLIKKNIPTLFLTGNEINAQDIRHSIISRAFPDNGHILFNELLRSLKNICYKQDTFFVIIIDGINENPNQKLFSEKLESFISEIIEHDFIRIVLSCRSEYYQYNFHNLDESAFAPELIKITSLLNRNPNNNINNKLFQVYIDHFKIIYQDISKKAYDQLTSNFLLLRIFCEAYQNQNLSYIDNIYKEELFEKYYSLKSEEINRRLKQNDEFHISGSFDIKNFISNIVSYMINNRAYVNIPLDKIIEDKALTEIYIHFLDENILVRRDIQTNENEIFSDMEVVNFTFDEFRDFLISRFLIEDLYKDSVARFTAFIENELDHKSPLQEGCSTYLFFISRRRSDTVLNKIVERQSWFNAVFSKCVFSLKDSQITETDKISLVENLKTGSYYSYSIIKKLIRRYDVNFYKNLNINFLLEFIRDLDEEDYNKYFINPFQNEYRAYTESDLDSLVNQIGEIFEEGKIDDYPSYHKLFELLIYFMVCEENWRIKSIYEQYIFRYKEIGKKQLSMALKCENRSLITILNKFIVNYEISL